MSKKRGQNEGTITRLPSGSWRAQITMNGHRVSNTAKTRTECQQWLRQKLAEMDSGLDPMGGRMKLSEYLKRWLEVEKTAWRPATTWKYELAIQHHIEPNIGHVRLIDLRLEMLEKLFSSLYSSGFGEPTIRVIHKILHGALAKAVRYRYIAINPATNATLPRGEKKEMKVLDGSQVSSFLITAKGSKYELLFRIAILYGLRKGELLGLTWSDIQWDNGTMHICKQAQWVKNSGWEIVEPKTRSGIRTIKLGDGTLQELKKHRDVQEARKVELGKRWKDKDLIFSNQSGGIMINEYLRDELNRILREAGLSHIRFHDLRHTAASIMLNNGVPVFVVSKILGHSNPSITLNVYGHLFQERQDEHTRRIEELFMPVAVELPQAVPSMPQE